MTMSFSDSISMCPHSPGSPNLSGLPAPEHTLPCFFQRKRLDPEEHAKQFRFSFKIFFLKSMFSIGFVISNFVMEGKALCLPTCRFK